MLEHYFSQPKTVDRIRLSWLAKPIEQYVAWMAERRFAASSIARRVPLILRFGVFTQRQGAVHVRELAGLLAPFVRRELRGRLRPFRSPQARRVFMADLRRPLEQMLRVVRPRRPTGKMPPLAGWAPDFFAHLREERGLREATIELYRYHLSQFEDYVSRRGIKRPGALTPATFDGFIIELRQRGYRPGSLPGVCAALRALLRFLFRKGRMRTDLSGAVDAPRIYRLAEIPRSISSDDVLRTLKCVDRRAALGKRDYAILILLAVYGLRAREVSALTLDDVTWRTGTLHVRGRKAGHATSYPLAPQARDALIDYLQHGRPATTDRHIFFIARAPREPISGQVVTQRCRHYLSAAGVSAPRLGSHTLRHSVAQRLVDADFSLKVIGDYLGHRSPSSTRVYTKVAIEALREVALGDGEKIL